ncbi:MAG: TVP38/TMEM64 family protein [Myxococcales bacterium]|nr:TVP38/TMEM64 family protein [Myxococcales bacterium]
MATDVPDDSGTRPAWVATVARLLVLVAVLALLVEAHRQGLLGAFDSPTHARDFIRRGGALAQALYVLSFTLLGAFAVPGVVFLLAAALLWSPWETFGLGMLGALLGSLLGFVVARFVARSWFERHMPPKMHRFDHLLATHALLAVILVRLLFFLSPAGHWLLGLSKVSVGKYLLGTAIGILPGVILISVFGSRLVSWLGSQPAWVWLVLAVPFIIMVVAMRSGRRRNARAAEDESS